MKRLAFVLAALATLVHIDSLAWSAETPRHGGRLVFGIGSDIISLNPFYRTDPQTSSVPELTYEALWTCMTPGSRFPGRRILDRCLRTVRLIRFGDGRVRSFRTTKSYGRGRQVERRICPDQKNAATGNAIRKTFAR